MTKSLRKRLAIVTRDEEYKPETRIYQLIEKWLDKIVLDTYNHTYVVQVTIDEVEDDLTGY